MDKIRVLFLCGERSPWGYAHLKPLLDEPRFQVVAVVLATESRWRLFRKALSGEQQPRSVNWVIQAKRFAVQFLKRDGTSRTLKVLGQRKIPIIWCDDANTSESINAFRAFSPDLLFSAAYPQIFKAQLLEAFRYRAFNSHPSLLPRCRGAHPVFWAIASGETRTGSTIHALTTNLDQGAIFAQLEVEILENDMYSQLYAKLNSTVPQLIAEFADCLMTPDCEGRPQLQECATCFRNDRNIHRRIFWSEMDATQIHNLVRACDGSAYFWYVNQRIAVKAVRIFDSNPNLTNHITVPKGTVVDIDHGKPIVAAQSGFVLLAEIEISRLRRPVFRVGMVLS